MGGGCGIYFWRKNCVLSLRYINWDVNSDLKDTEKPDMYPALDPRGMNFSQLIWFRVTGIELELKPLD